MFRKKKVKLSESARMLGSGIVANKEDMTLDNVCVLSGESKNGYKYSEKAQLDFCELINNYPAHHVHGDRKIRNIKEDFIGTWAGARYDKEQNKVFAKINVIKPEWERMSEIARLNPKNIGFSLEGDGIMDRKNKEVVEMTKVYCVALTDGPATTSTLSEGVIADYEKAEELDRKIRKKTWSAVDLITSTLRDKSMSVSDRKKKCLTVLNDFEAELTPLITELKALEADEETQEMSEKTHKELMEAIGGLKEALGGPKDKPANEPKGETPLTEAEIRKQVVGKMATVELELQEAKIPDEWKEFPEIKTELLEMDEEGRKKRIKVLEKMHVREQDGTRTNRTPKSVEQEPYPEEGTKLTEQQREVEIKKLKKKISG